MLIVGMQGAEAEDSSEVTHADGHAHEHGNTAPEDPELRLNEDLALRVARGLESEPASGATEPVPGDFTTGGFTSKNVE